MVYKPLNYLQLKENKIFCNKFRILSSPYYKASSMEIMAPRSIMNQSEFLNLVMPFKDKLFRLAKRLLVSTEEAEDATQEILLKLWSGKNKFESYNNVEAFAMKSFAHRRFIGNDTSIKGFIEHSGLTGANGNSRFGDKNN